MANLIIKESNIEISKDINRALAKMMNKMISQYRLPLINALKKKVEGWVFSQPEITSILTPKSPENPVNLSDTFNLDPALATTAAASIVNAVVKSTRISVSNFSNNLKGYIELACQPSDFNNLLSISYGYTYLNDENFHWLKWLLLEGDKTIIVNYNLDPENASNIISSEESLAFRVNPRFSGTENNNFITRAFQGREKEISTIFKNVLNV